MTQRRATSRVIRVLVPLVACTLLGAVATVLGTWAMAVWGPLPLPISLPATPTTRDWPMPLPAKLRQELDAMPRVTPGAQTHRSWLGYRPEEQAVAETGWCTAVYARSLGYTTSLIARDKPSITMAALQFGWPCRAMAFAKVWASQRNDFGDSFVEGWPIPKLLGQSERRLPLTPLWPGFAINTLVYAAAAWGVWQIPLALRRRRRRKANRCVNCGYDRKGLKPDAACPECGTKAG